MADRILDVKLDLLGSSLTLGFTDFRRTRAVRRGIVRNLRNDRNDNSQAIEDATRTAGAFHHSVENLPLASVRSVKFGAKKALVRLDYRYSVFRNPFGNLPAKTTTRLRTTELRTPVYRALTDQMGNFQVADGLPNGHLVGVPQNRLSDETFPSPRPYFFLRPAVKIIVETTLDFNPMGNVVNLIKAVNSEGVLFAGFSFGAGTIMFDALDVDWNIQTTSGRDPRTVRLVFHVAYHFTAVSGGHSRQHLVRPGELIGGTPSPVFTTVNESTWLRFPFANVFPVHAGGLI